MEGAGQGVGRRGEGIEGIQGEGSNPLRSRLPTSMVAVIPSHIFQPIASSSLSSFFDSGDSQTLPAVRLLACTGTVLTC